MIASVMLCGCDFLLNVSVSTSLRIGGQFLKKKLQNVKLDREPISSQYLTTSHLCDCLLNFFYW